MSTASFFKGRYLALSINLRDLMQIPIELINQPDVVYIADEFGNKLPLPIRVMGGLSLPERELIKAVSKEHGEQAIVDAIKEIANIVAPLNGNDPVKIAQALQEYREGSDNPLADYKGYFIMHCSKEFDRFNELLTVDANAWERSARIHVVLNRVPAGSYKVSGFDKEFKWNPRDWKTEYAMDGEKLKVSIADQIDIFCRAEIAGTVSRFIKRVNPLEGPAYDEFTYGNLKAEAEPEKDKPEKETAEAIAKK